MMGAFGLKRIQRHPRPSLAWTHPSVPHPVRPSLLILEEPHELCVLDTIVAEGGGEWASGIADQ